MFTPENKSLTTKIKQFTVLTVSLVVVGLFSFEAYSQQGNTSEAITYETRFIICHGEKTLFLPLSALAAHIQHGDYYGECNPSSNKIFSLSATTKNVSCYNSKDAAIDLTVTFKKGHVKPTKFIWSNGAISEDLSGIGAGIYSVTVSIVNGHSSSAEKHNEKHTAILSILITEPSALQMDIKAVDVKCNGDNNGQAQTYLTGGTLPYTYQWDDAGNQRSASATGLSGGIYNVIVADYNGCLARSSVTINEPSPLSLSAQTFNVRCYGGRDGSASLTVSGGISPYQYQWNISAGSQSTSSATALAAGDYNVVVRDANACSDSINAAITQPEPLKLTYSSTNTSCSGNDGSATINAFGAISPYSYLWDAASKNQLQATATGLGAGTYTATVSDNNGCSGSIPVTIVKNNCPATTKLQDQYSGTTVIALNQAVTCDVVFGATDYQWEISHPATGYFATYIRGNNLNNFNFMLVGGIGYGKTYDIRIRPKTVTGWLEYGAVSRLSTPWPVPPTKLIASHCNIKLSTLNVQVNCDAVQGASDYEWEFSHPATGFYTTFLRGNKLTNLALTWVMGLEYGKTYNVRVRAMAGNDWGSFGTMCTLTTPWPVPETKVRTADCGITLTSLSQRIFCNAIAAATDYEWEISNAAAGFVYTHIRTNSTNDFFFSWIFGVLPGTTYSVRVRAIVGSDTALYGIACNITTPPPAKVGNNNGNAKSGSSGTKPSEFTVYPNPLAQGSQLAMVLTSGKETQQLQVDVYDMTGKKVLIQQVMSAPNIPVSISSNNLPTGVYVMQITTLGSETSRFEKLFVR